MKKIVFATNNIHKLSEVRAIAGPRLEIVSLSDIGCREELPETSDTLEGNARQKACYVRDHYGVDCFADDTGLMVDALGGAPGVYTARFAGPDCLPDDNIDLLLEKMHGVVDRRAEFRTVVALACADDRQGDGGFGYDPVFIPRESGVSFAEMGPEAKNVISHRGRAIRAFIAEIDSI